MWVDLMAGKKKNSAPERGSVVHFHVGDGAPGDERQADDEEISAIDSLEEGQLSRAIEEVRNTEGAYAEVHRILPPEKEGFCRKYPVSIFSHERIATDYGPGKYRVRFKGPGDKYIKGGGTFAIAESLTAATAGGMTGVDQVLALFKAERERDKEEAARKKGEWLEWAKLLAPLVAPKILDLLGGGSKAPSLRDMVATMKDMKDLQAPQADLTAQFSQVIGILEGAKSLVGDDGGNKVGSTWVDLLRDFMASPAMGALASAIPIMGRAPNGLPSGSLIATQSRNPPVAATPPLAAGPTDGAPGAVAPGSPDMLAQLNWLRGTLAQLLVQVHKQANPRLYAEVVLDNLPPFITAKELLERLGSDTWWTQLQSIDARVAPHAEWFQKFRDYAVKSLRRRERKAELQSEPPPGDGLNQPMAEGEGDQYE